ncbi:MAG: hypothetical protein QOF51_2738, partial [Chloroflexota bacterium]|nr:hypothetical protein [Chloroflexota bacterium]
MGEAWFTGERRLFTELLEVSVFQASEELLIRALDGIVGCMAFGPRQEWHDWLLYLLPRVVERLQSPEADPSLLPRLIAAFMAVYWRELPEEYPGFRSDAIDSLGRCLMSPAMWGTGRHWDPRGGTAPNFIARRMNQRRYLGQGLRRIAGLDELSASMFFCIKYLDYEVIPAWVDSVVHMERTEWQYCVALWLLPALAYLERGPALPERLGWTFPSLAWFGSSGPAPHLQSRPGGPRATDFLPHENVEMFVQCVRQHVPVRRQVDWIADLAEPLLLEASASPRKDGSARIAVIGPIASLLDSVGYASASDTPVASDLLDATWGNCVADLFRGV